MRYVSVSLSVTTDENIKGSPDLLIEILSPSTEYYGLIEKIEI